jgi:hypothetical protein
VMTGVFGFSLMFWQKEIVEFLIKDDTILHANYNMFLVFNCFRYYPF